MKSKEYVILLAHNENSFYAHQWEMVKKIISFIRPTLEYETVVNANLK